MLEVVEVHLGERGVLGVLGEQWDLLDVLEASGESQDVYCNRLKAA